MKKKDLLAMRVLKATPTMLKTARKDIPQKEKSSSWGSSDKRKYDLFIRCMLENGILKVALFSPKAMRLGGRLPLYDVFIDKSERKYLTYDYENKRWLKGKLDRIDWPYRWTGTYERWISQADDRLLKEYFGTEKSGLQAVLEFQHEIGAEELIKRHKRQTDKWDADLEQTPDLPKDWERWVNKVGVREHYIFYDYVKKGADHGYCTYCEKEVPIRNPYYNKVGKCPRCRHRVTFKSTGKAGQVNTEYYAVYLMQQCKDGVIIREFKASHTYPRGQYKTPRLYCNEVRRAIFDSNGKPLRAYYWGLYKQRYVRWIATTNCAPNWNSYYGYSYGRVYGRTLPHLAKKGLNKTGVLEHIQQTVLVDPEQYLAVYNVFPMLEQLSKASLPALVKECLNGYYRFREKLCVVNDTSLTKSLGIHSQELKRLRRSNGNTDYLAWLRCENSLGKEIPDHIIAWFCKERIEWKDIQFIADRMNVVQIYNYIRRNMDVYKMKSHEVITTWADYLSMAVRFKYDVSDEIVYRTSKLKQRHDELAARSIDANITIQAGQILQKFPHLDDIIRSLEKKYAYTGEEYTILAPINIEEIIREGNCLHHCIANSERYWERMEKHESYLLFLRKADLPKQPYYTMEIEPGGTVRQIRTYYDRQNEDIEKARAFLKEWQAVVAERMTEADKQKAKESKEIRMQEFAQLRKDQIKIHTGALSGKLLVDVLVADLMENKAA